jgi:hypothetical protein
MQQRQLRLGDILDDYCPRERRLTNHAVVAMVGDEVKQTRCTTCDAEHEYKHARIPRQRKKSDAPSALFAQVLAGGPKKVAPPAVIGHLDDEEEEAAAQADETTATDRHPDEHDDDLPADTATPAVLATAAEDDEPVADELSDDDVAEEDEGVEEGPVHRPLIRAQLPRPEGQPAPTRPAPDFTIRQPGGRPGRFRPRNQRGGGPFQGGAPRHGGGGHGGGHGRPPVASRHGSQGPQGHQGRRKRSK